MSRLARTESRLGLVCITILCLIMAGCVPGFLRREPERKRVVYLGIEKAPPALDQAVSNRVDPGYVRVPASAYHEAAQRLQAESMKDEDVAKVATELSADVVIHGRYVRKNKRRAHVEVMVRAGATGVMLGKYVLPVRRDGMTPRGERRLDDEFRPQLEAFLGAPPSTPAPQPVETEPTEAVAGTGPEEQADEPEDTDEVEASPTRATPVAAKPGKTAPAENATQAKAADAKAGKTKPVDTKPAKPADTKPASAEPAPPPAPPAPIDLEYNDDGQVIDDEEPPPVKKKKK
jgi:hypothetical protein